MPGMKWIEPIVFSKNSGKPIFGQIFGHQRAKNGARNTKMNGGQETHPIRVNARYEMNWVNSFFKKFRKPCLQTDGQTDRRPERQTDRHQGESGIPHSTFGWARVYSETTWAVGIAQLTHHEVQGGGKNPETEFIPHFIWVTICIFLSLTVLENSKRTH